MKKLALKTPPPSSHDVSFLLVSTNGAHSGFGRLAMGGARGAVNPLEPLLAKYRTIQGEITKLQTGASQATTQVCENELVRRGGCTHGAASRLLRRCTAALSPPARRPRPVVCSPRKPRLPCRAAGRAACRAAALSFATVRAYGPRHRCRRRRYRRRPHLNRRTYGRRRPPPSRLHLAASATTITVHLPGAQGARAAGGGRAGVQAHRAGASQAGACRGQVERAPPPAALPRRLCRRHPAAATKAWQVGR